MRLIYPVLLGLIGDGAAAEPQAAPPQSNDPLKFQIVREAKPGCEPSCAEWIAAEGKFVGASVRELEKVLAQAGKRRLPIVIHSPGGDIDAAQAMGRVMRARRIDVAVGRTILKPAPLAPPRRDDGVLRGEAQSYGGWCASACSLFIAGASRRFIAPTARVGVHDFHAGDRKLIWTQRFYRDKIWRVGDRVVRREREWLADKQHTQVLHDDPEYHAHIESGVEAYLRKMGVSEPIPKLMAATPYASIHVLTRSELMESRLLTNEGGVELLVALYRPERADDAVALPSGGASGAVAKTLLSDRNACLMSPLALRPKCQAWRAAPLRPPFAPPSAASLDADFKPSPVLTLLALPDARGVDCGLAAKSASREETSAYETVVVAAIQAQLPRPLFLGVAHVAVFLLIDSEGRPLQAVARTQERWSNVSAQEAQSSLMALRFAPPPTGCFYIRRTFTVSR